MAEVYAQLIIAGRREIKDVPENLRKEVEKRVKELKANA